jgi:hypothetical protein
MWVDASRPRAVRAGFRFAETSREASWALYDLALWEVVQEQPDRVIYLHGELSEATALWPVLRHLVDSPIIDLSHIVRINSAGSLRWLEFLQRMPAGMELRLRRISVPLVRQMILVPIMTSRCLIESFYVPLECETCDTDLVELISAADPPTMHVCDGCGGPLRLTEPLLPFESYRSSLGCARVANA